MLAAMHWLACWTFVTPPPVMQKQDLPARMQVLAAGAQVAMLQRNTAAENQPGARRQRPRDSPPPVPTRRAVCRVCREPAAGVGTGGGLSRGRCGLLPARSGRVWGGEGASEHSAGQRLARPIRPWGRRRDQIRCPGGRCDLRGRRRRRLWLRWACVPGAARLGPLCVCALCFVGLSRLCARAEILVKVRPCMF